MLNFTGSSNRRVVNLSERRKPKGATFLQQVQSENRNREEKRRRDRAAAVIVSYVISHLILRREADKMALEWVQSYPNHDTSLWCYQFAFIMRHSSAEFVGTALHTLTGGVAQLDGCFGRYDVAVIAKGLRYCLNRGIEDSLALECLKLLFERYELPVEYPHAVSGLSKSVLRYMDTQNPEKAIKVAFRLQRVDSPTNFPFFLASLPTSHISADSTMAEITRGILLHHETIEEIKNMTETEQLLFLANTVKILDSSFHEKDCGILAVILSKLAFVVRVFDETSERSARENVVEFRAVGVVKDALMLLDNPAHLAIAANQLRGWNTTHTYPLLMPYLFSRFPDLRPKLCMVSTVSPGLLKSVFAQLCNESILASGQFEIDLSLFSRQIGAVLFCYSHLVSYWLTVTNDHETFQDTSFSLADATALTSFLKELVLALIFEPAKFSGSPLMIIQQRDISISALNQLYMKNLRVHFLPDGFWIVKSLKVNKNSMLALLQEEQRRIDEETSSSSEDEPVLSETALAYVRAQPPRKKYIVEAGPIVEILKKLPFFVDFTERVEVFRGLIADERIRLNIDSGAQFFAWDPHMNNLKADIRRGHVLEDAFEEFHKVGEAFKNQLRVTFHNEHGEEVGIDGGGITKELLTALVTEAFSPESDLQLFSQTDQYNLYPNPEIFLKLLKNIDRAKQLERLAYMRFMGMVIGKCLFEGVLIDFKFAHFFVSKWRVAQNGTKSSIDDLAYLDGNLFRNLCSLMDMSEEDIAALDLNFEINEVIDGKIYTFPLGHASESNRRATRANRLTYIHLVSHFKLNQCLQTQTAHFVRGLFDVIRPNWLNMFDPFELQMLVGGTNEIDLQDWKRNVNYGGYWETDRAIQFFWEVVEEMDRADQQALVKFVTSASRAPLLGFGALEPKFGISRVPDDTRLPTASTCANLLKLPNFKLKLKLKEKLLYAIHANSGFDLS